MEYEVSPHIQNLGLVSFRTSTGVGGSIQIAIIQVAGRDGGRGVLGVLIFTVLVFTVLIRPVGSGRRSGSGVGTHDLDLTTRVFAPPEMLSVSGTEKGIWASSQVGIVGMAACV